MTSARFPGIVLSILIALSALPSHGLSQVAILEFSCPVCGYRQQFVQGAQQSDKARNVQHIIVVCERAKQIRNITIALDPKLPVRDEPLLARQYGTGQSDLLGIKLPRFLVPGNTCPLFPVAAFLERNICPVHGSAGLRFAVVARY